MSGTRLTRPPAKKWVELKKGKVKWHVRIMARNGEIVLVSQSYFSKSNASRAAYNVGKSLNIPVYRSKGSK